IRISRGLNFASAAFCGGKRGAATRIIAKAASNKPCASSEHPMLKMLGESDFVFRESLPSPFFAGRYFTLTVKGSANLSRAVRVQMTMQPPVRSRTCPSLLAEDPHGPSILGRKGLAQNGLLLRLFQKEPSDTL